MIAWPSQWSPSVASSLHTITVPQSEGILYPYCFSSYSSNSEEVANLIAALLHYGRTTHTYQVLTRSPLPTVRTFPSSRAFCALYCSVRVSGALQPCPWTHRSFQLARSRLLGRLLALNLLYRRQKLSHAVEKENWMEL